MGRIFEEEQIVERSAATGVYFWERLQSLQRKHSIIEDVRGVGLLLGLGLQRPGEDIVQQCMKRGFLINCVQENVLRFVPPLIVGKTEIDALTECLDDVLQD